MADGSYGMGGGPVPPLTKAWLWGFMFGFGSAVIAVVFLLLAGVVHAREQTNGNRGMLRYDEAFGSTPKIKLCEFTKNGVVKLRACPKPEKK